MSKYFIKSILLFLFIATCQISLNAKHIIGGDVVYECMGIDTIRKEVTFKIIFTMYRDSKSNGAQIDPRADFGIYRGGGNIWRHVNTIDNVSRGPVEEIDIVSTNPCILIPVNVGVEKGVYEFTIKLPIINETYLISYQRCCRNETILNLNSPGDTGAAFTTEISPEAQLSCNNSPKFTNFPPVVICVNRPIDFNHSAFDIDGDSLAYEFCAPLTAGGTDGATTPGSPDACTGVTPSPRNCIPPYSEVAFKGPKFSASVPMAGNPVVYIDPKTGIIGGSPSLLGQFVVGVCVKEYRNGKLIGTLRRDFQFNVTTCETAVSANLEASVKDRDDYVINSCGDFTIDFKNLSTDVRFIQNYYWEFNINGSLKTYSSRDVSVTFPGLGKYTATMILNKDLPDLADCSDTANITVNLFPSIKTDFTFDYDTCSAGPIAFTDLSVSGAGPVLKWSWEFIEGRSNLQNPSFEFEAPGEKTVKLTSEDINKCIDTSIKKINYFPVPATIIIDPNTFVGCQPASIYFDNLSTPIDETYDLSWTFGDGGTSKEIDPTYTYEDIGTYSVSLAIVSPIGCEIVKNFNSLISVVPSPTAGFSFTPDNPSLSNNTIQFIDESIDAISYQWTFDTLGISLLSSPSYTFRDTGTYTITQIVLHPSGCTDTFAVQIPIYPFVNLFIPNAFTPNNDGLNDHFKPKGAFEGIAEYTFTVWNRWGDNVFSTNNYDEGWNGQRNNVGQSAPPGVYAYVIDYVDVKGDKKTLKGHCTLLR